jgi:hypothetical protein
MNLSVKGLRTTGVAKTGAEALAEVRVGQAEALAVVVVGDKEVHRLAQGIERATKPPAAWGETAQIGAQIRVHALDGVCLLFAARNHVGGILGPDQLGIDSMPIAREAPGGGEGVHPGLQGEESAVLARGLAHT